MTSVWTKNPTKGSSSGCGRPATGVPAEERLERGEQDHELARSAAARDLADARLELRPELEPMLPPATGRKRGPRVIRRETEGRDAVEPALPEGERALERASREPRPLPGRVVAVADRERCEPRGAAFTPRRVELRHVTQEHRERPAVAHGVMHADRQDVLAIAEPVEARAELRNAAEIERASRVGSEGFL